MTGGILGAAAEQILPLPSVNLVGNRKAEICNYKGLLSVSRECVCVSTRAGDLAVEGHDLEVAEIAREYITVRGAIRRIYYKEKDYKEKDQGKR